MMKVAIHQPDFMPWLGFFSKINKADKWVVLNHTMNNPRDAAFWGRRVKMLINGNPIWVSLPLEKPQEKGIIGIPINSMRFSYLDPTIYDKTLSQIYMAYKKAPFFTDVFPLVDSFFSSEEKMMETRNMGFISGVMQRLGIETEIIFSDEMNCTETSTELLIEILKKTRADVYICGGGASGYQNDELFDKNGIRLEYNDFEIKAYPQFNSNESFKEGLSIVDCLMNVGFDNLRNFL